MSYETDSAIYRGYLSFFSINTGFIFIEWYENKHFMSGGRHEWNMIIFKSQDENKSCIYRQKIICCLLYTFFSHDTSDYIDNTELK
jgi:hypothetical protein